MNAETVTLTAELRDEVSAPAQRMAGAVETANRRVEASASRSASGTKRAAATITGASDGVARNAGKLTRATTRAHDGVARSWSGLSGRVRSAGEKVTTAARESGARAGDQMGRALTDRFTVATAGLAAAAGLVGLGMAASEAVTQYSNLQDASAAAEVVFGSHMASITAQAANAGETLGMTQAQVIDAANTFGTYGKAAGMSWAELAGFSTEMTALAGDMASFKGTSPEQAIEAIGAALRGETEPIRAYGVMLDDASLKAQAMAMGLIATTKEALTPQQKTLAAHALILKQTSDAQGDFSRTADSAANVQKRLSAAVTNLQAQVGGVLEPAFTRARLAILGAVVGIGAFLTKVSQAVALLQSGALSQDVAAALGLGPGATAAIAEGIGSVRAFYSTLKVGERDMANITSDGVAGWAERIAIAINQVRALSIPWGTILGAGTLMVLVGTVQRLGGVLALVGRVVGPLLPILGQLGAFLRLLGGPAALIAGALFVLYTRSELFRGAANGLLGTLVTLAAQTAGALAPVLSMLASTVLPVLASTFAQVVPIVAQVAAVALTLGGQLLATLVPILLTLITTILPPVAQLFAAVVQVLGAVLSAVLPLLPPVLQLAAFLLNLALGVVTPLLGILAQLVGALATGLAGALAYVMPHVSTFLGGFQGVVSWFQGTLGPMIDRVKGWFESLGGVIGGALDQVRGFMDNPAVNAVRGFLGFAGGGVVGYSGGGVAGFAGGGVLSGYAPGRDTVPAMLSRGEAVLTPELTRMLGPENIKAANWAASRRRGGSGTTSAGPTANPRALLGGGSTSVAVNVTYSGAAASPAELRGHIKAAMREADAERARREYGRG